MSRSIQSNILISVVLSAVMAGGAYVLDTAGTTMGIVGRSAALGGLLLAMLLVVSLLSTRRLARYRRRLVKAGEESGPASDAAPFWLQSIAVEFDRLMRAGREREKESCSERRELEVRLRIIEAERDRNAAVIETLRDAVVVTDAFDEVVLSNQAAAYSLGFDQEEAQHAPLSQLMGESMLPRAVTEVRDSGVNAPSRRFEQQIAITHNGEERQVIFDTLVKAIGNHSGDAAWVVSVLHDLSQERELSQMKTDFVAKASHELRTPLSSIRAYVEMLVDGEATDEESRADFYGIIQSETDRLGRLIDNMLNISRIEAGIVQIDRVEVDMKSLIERAVDTIEPQAAEKNIKVIARPSDVDLCVEGDADMVYQVMLNLVSNAVKYTPDGGRVTIAADSDNLTRSIVVSVSDTGLGIPPDDLERVFEKFYRVDNYKRVAKGTGLGLSLCKHIVETVHRGQIGVDSTLGMGSKFWFSIPMRYVGMQTAA